MKKVYFFGFRIIALAFTSCNQSSSLDYSKLDTAYFVGEYEANYENETEKLILKDDLHYDYIHVQKADTIVDAGEWFYSKRDWVTITVKKFPNNIRKNNMFLTYGKKHNISFSVNTNMEREMGNLEFLVSGGEDGYIFEKLDKGRNKNYLTK
jgi:hypothetical protein